MSVTHRLQNTQISPKVAGASVVCLLVVCVAGVLVAKNIATGPASGSPARSSSAQAAGLHKTGGASSAAPRSTKILVNGEEGDPCQLIAERNIFKPVVASNPGPSGDRGGGPGSSMNSIPTLPVAGFSAIPSDSNPFGGRSSSRSIAFTGVVETPEGLIALLENTSTSETRLVGVGEYAFGTQVLEVDSQTCSLDYDGSPITLALGENKSDTNNSAPGGQQQQQRTASVGRRQSSGSQSASQSDSQSSTNESSSQDQGPGGTQNNGGNFGPPGGGPGGFGGPPPGFGR